jgi:hypothetical protein
VRSVAAGLQTNHHYDKFSSQNSAMNQTPTPNPTEALQVLCDRFRDTKHDTNNVFAVLLAMAELGERNPANYERLGRAVLERCPKVVQDLQSFQEELFATLERFRTKP